MKRVISILIISILVSFSLSASALAHTFQQVNTDTKDCLESVEINIHYVSDPIQDPAPIAGGLKCDVSVTVSVGVVSVTVTAKDIDCSTVSDTIKKLKKMAMDQIKLLNESPEKDPTVDVISREHSSISEASVSTDADGSMLHP